MQVLRNMADDPAISSVDYCVLLFCGNHETLHEPRSINCYPETASRVGGGGRKLGTLVQTSIKRPPLLFRRYKKGGRIIEQVRYM